MSTPYQNTTDALEIAVKALALALSNARLESAPAHIMRAISSYQVRLSAFRMEVVNNPAALEATGAGNPASRPLGPNGAMIEVHPTTAWVYDQVMNDGVFEINPTTNPKGIPFLRRAIQQIVAAGVAYGHGEHGLIKKPCKIEV